MLSIWIIALFVIVFMRDALPGAGGSGAGGSGGLNADSGLSFGGFLAPGSIWVWLLGLLPYAVIALIVHGVLHAAAREIDRSGSRRALLLADRTVALSRALVVGVHFGNVMLLGWLTSARALVGDVILLDELLCIVPPILVFVAGWFSAYAIDRRLREAALFRTVESGRTVYAPPTRGQFVVSNARNMLALPLAPLVFLAAWGELGDRALQRLAAMKYDPGLLGRFARWMGAGEGHAEYAKIVLQLIGVALVMALAPLAVRVLWDTVRMSSGVMRDRLLSMCRASRVRVNEILVWRTHGTMTNGAVVGLSGRLRYVLLTDALLEAMPSRQVEAVMAHEIAHARHAHIPWLAVVFLSAFGCIAALASVAWNSVLDLAGVSMTIVTSGLATGTTARAAGSGADGGVYDAVVSGTSAGPHDLFTVLYVVTGDAMVTIGSLIGGVLVLGFVSRRFEWQADAFAAKSLSTLGSAVTEPDPRAIARTHEADGYPDADLAAHGVRARVCLTDQNLGGTGLPTSASGAARSTQQAIFGFAEDTGQETGANKGIRQTDPRTEAHAALPAHAAPAKHTPLSTLDGGITILSDGVWPREEPLAASTGARPVPPGQRATPPATASATRASPSGAAGSGAVGSGAVGLGTIGSGTIGADVARVETATGANADAGIVHRAAVDAMAEALQTVATLNAIPRHRASFRHGSIAQRQRKLRELVGLPLEELPIDRTVRWIKRAAAVGLVALVAMMVFVG